MKGINICFYGLNRSLQTTFGSIEELIINPCKAICTNTNIYASFNLPQDSKIFSKRSQEQGSLASSGDPSKLLSGAHINYINQDEFDNTFDFEEIVSYGDFFKDHEAKTSKSKPAGSIVNQLRALNSLRHSYLSIPPARRRQHPTFFIRPDLTVIEPLDIDLILNLCSLKNSSVVPSWHHWYGINDRFAVCSAGKASDSYALRLNYLSNFLKASDKFFHPERYLYSILSLREITIFPVINSRFIRIRSDDRIHKESMGNLERMPVQTLDTSWGKLVEALYAERDKNKSIHESAFTTNEASKFSIEASPSQSTKDKQKTGQSSKTDSKNNGRSLKIKANNWTANRLSKLASINNTKTYLEIGAQNGHTFNELKFEHMDAVDPHFLFDYQSLQTQAKHFFEETSDSFFSSKKCRPNYDLIFINGLHSYDHAYRNFCNALTHSSSNTIILINDVYPYDRFTTLKSREDYDPEQRKAHPESGNNRISTEDIFKLLPLLALFHTNLNYATLKDNTSNQQTVLWSRKLEKGEQKQPFKSFTNKKLLFRAVNNLKKVDSDWVKRNARILNPTTEQEILDYLKLLF